MERVARQRDDERFKKKKKGERECAPNMYVLSIKNRARLPGVWKCWVTTGDAPH